jgi:hypothetical protein
MSSGLPGSKLLGYELHPPALVLEPLHLLAEGRVAHGNDTDNAAEGAQIGCGKRRPRALKRAIIVPHETPNQKRKVSQRKMGGTPNAPR